jgi:hypothetical protein
MEKTQDARAWRELALKRRGSGDYEGARAAARRAFELGGDDTEVLVTYFWLMGEFGQFAEQRRLLERARALGLEDWRWNRLIGLWQLREGDYAAR